MKKISNSYSQRGAVSLFIVVFAALLITIVTVSFVRIMLQDQQQATTTDLSQSAYDSAQAGVEDAKRALLKYQDICNSGGDCVNAANKINSPTCNEAIGTLQGLQGVTLSNNEVKVQTGTDSSNQTALDQAYTCVKIALNTDDYLGTLKANESNIVPLSSMGSFNTVQIQWFSTKDASGTINLQSDSKVPLLKQWGGLNNPRPPIIRAQFIQFSGSSGFTLGNFDSSIVDNGANTLFLYPSKVGLNSKSLSIDTPRKMPTGNPQSVKCLDSIGASVYSCFAKIGLPKLITGADHTLFLHLSSLYNKTDYRITLYDSASPALTVPFNAVQPQIDSTGRANDLFRRVQTRVELTDVNFPYPEAAVDITGSFCKGFSVTDNSDDYNNGNVGQITDCNP